MTDSTTRPPRTHAALSLAADGRWTGDRESLRRQLVVVEAEAAEIENTRWLEQSAIAERSRAEAAAPAPDSESWLARGDHWLARAEAAAPERFDRSWWHYADDCPVAPDAGLREAARAVVNSMVRLEAKETVVSTRKVVALAEALAAHPAPAPDRQREVELEEARAYAASLLDRVWDLGQQLERKTVALTAYQEAEE